MTDIEVKRKELETAKRIAGMPGRFCGVGESAVKCFADNCPVKHEIAPMEAQCLNWDNDQWDAFIATREAELAELDKKDPTAPERLYPRAKGATGPTVDDFALALIHSGFYNPYEPDYAERTYGIAEKLKAESDRRRS